MTVCSRKGGRRRAGEGRKTAMGSRLRSGDVSLPRPSRARDCRPQTAPRAKAVPRSRKQSPSRKPSTDPDQPPRRKPLPSERLRQPHVGRAELDDPRAQVSHSPVGKAVMVNEEEKIDSTRDHPRARRGGLPGDESLPKVEGTANPRKIRLAISITKMTLTATSTAYKLVRGG